MIGWLLDHPWQALAITYGFTSFCSLIALSILLRGAVEGPDDW
jgi:hypothetical protein